MSGYAIALSLHVLAATIWTGHRGIAIVRHRRCCVPDWLALLSPARDSVLSQASRSERKSLFSLLSTRFAPSNTDRSGCGAPSRASAYSCA